MSDETTYKVIKETATFRFCEQCKGAGKKTHTLRGEKFTNTCAFCKGTGKQKVIHRTEVTLKEALEELGFWV